MKQRKQTLPEALRAADSETDEDQFGEEWGRSPMKPDRRCGLLIRLTPTLRQKLKLKATASGQSMQCLVLQAIIELLESGHAPARKGPSPSGRSNRPTR